MSLFTRINKFPIKNIYTRLYCTNKDDIKIPINKLANQQSAQFQNENGAIYDKKPFKITLTKDKVYGWCLCGKSKSQPLCDGTHKNIHYKITLKPVRFKVEKDGEYWLCNCKQTKNRPYCDGTHKRADIQQAIR